MSDNDDEPVLAAREPSGVLGVLLTMLIMVFGVGVAMALPILSENMLEIFEDFDTGLPTLTLVVLSPPPVAWSVLYASFAAAALAAHGLIRVAIFRLTILNILLAVVMLVSGIIAFALFLPMVHLIRSPG